MCKESSQCSFKGQEHFCLCLSCAHLFHDKKQKISDSDYDSDCDSGQVVASGTDFILPTLFQATLSFIHSGLKSETKFYIDF